MAIAQIVDMVLLVLPPSGGDELQGIKKGECEMRCLRALCIMRILTAGFTLPTDETLGGGQVTWPLDCSDYRIVVRCDVVA